MTVIYLQIGAGHLIHFLFDKIDQYSSGLPTYLYFERLIELCLFDYPLEDQMQQYFNFWERHYWFEHVPCDAVDDLKQDLWRLYAAVHMSLQELLPQERLQLNPVRYALLVQYSAETAKITLTPA